MIYIASIPRCGSTYLFRSIAGLSQGGSTPPGAQEKYGIVKTHRPPDGDPRVRWREGDRAIFVFGPVVEAVLSTQRHRHDPNHFRNCGVDYDPTADLTRADLLDYERIWDAWNDPPFPVLCASYRSLAEDARPHIESWLGRRVAWLPWMPRRTVPTHEERARISDVYGTLIAKIAGALDVYRTPS